MSEVLRDLWHRFLELSFLLQLGYVSLLLAIILLSVFVYYLHSDKFRWVCFKLSLPFGKNSIKGLVKAETSGIASTDSLSKIENGWVQAERTLCTELYKGYITVRKDLNLWKQSETYLKRVGEIGRKPMPILMWPVIIGLLVIEAFGFGYVLAGWAIPGVSENLQQIAALGIAFVVSTVLIFSTHGMGRELYRNEIISQIENHTTSYKNKGEEVDTSKTPTLNIDLTPEEDQIDKNRPKYEQIIARIENKKKEKGFTIFTIVFIIIIAIFSTWVRIEVLNKQLIEEKANISTSTYEIMPPELALPQTQADNKAFDEAQAADRRGGWATFIVLAVLFVGIQFVGIMLGKKYGFVGAKSKEAYDTVANFKTNNEFINYCESKKEAAISIAQGKLSILQQELKKKGGVFNKKFTDFLAEKAEEFSKTKIEESNNRIKELEEQILTAEKEAKLQQQLAQIKQETAQAQMQNSQDNSTPQKEADSMPENINNSTIESQNNNVNNGAENQIEDLLNEAENILEKEKYKSSGDLSLISERKIRKIKEELEELGATAEIEDLDNKINRIKGDSNA